MSEKCSIDQSWAIFHPLYRPYMGDFHPLHRPYMGDISQQKRPSDESLFLVPRAGVEPARIAPLVFETSASTDSAIWAKKRDFCVTPLVAERERRKGDSNPRYGYPYDSLANCWFKPLTHLSV